MANKCITMEAKNFENKLNGLDITLNQFHELRKIWHELSPGGQAEVNDILKSYNKKDEKKSMTNADRIRNMSDEELTEFIKDGFKCGTVTGSGNYSICIGCNKPYCADVLQWLKTESK